MNNMEQKSVEGSELDFIEILDVAEDFVQVLGITHDDSSEIDVMSVEIDEGEAILIDIDEDYPFEKADEQLMDAVSEESTNEDSFDQADSVEDSDLI